MVSSFLLGKSQGLLILLLDTLLAKTTEETKPGNKEQAHNHHVSRWLGDCGITHVEVPGTIVPYAPPTVQVTIMEVIATVINIEVVGLLPGSVP